jgi:hypothetical protein
MQDGNTIWIDQNAAGHGWFLDALPRSNSEFFGPLTAEELRAPAGSPAHGKMDLLTVVEHEMRHVLGLPENEDPQGIMGETLETGIRWLPVLPSQARVDNHRIVRVVASTSAHTAGVDHLIESGELSSAFGIGIVDFPDPTILAPFAEDARSARSTLLKASATMRPVRK